MRPRLADPRKWNRPSAARHSPKGGRRSKPKGSDLRGARGESLGLWVRGESHEHDGFGAQASGSTTGRTAAPAGDRRCGAAEFGLRGRARGSHRLQKSTGGARPPSPMREERVDNEGRSSLGARERSRGERAPEAGPFRGKTAGTVAGSLPLSEMAGAKALSREHLSMEDVSGRTKSSVLTSGRWKRSWSSSQVGWEQSRHTDSGNRERRGRQGTSEVGRAASSEKTTLR